MAFVLSFTDGRFGLADGAGEPSRELLPSIFYVISVYYNYYYCFTTLVSPDFSV